MAAASSGDRADALLGQRLGKYLVLRRLGAGGMGVVYEAEDANLKRRVALKVLAGPVVQDLEARRRFLREAQSAARLNSPYIISIFDVGEDGDLIFLVMELFPGVSAQECLLEHGPFDWRTATRIAAAACRGVAAAHASGLVHRDIKPANIMLGRAQVPAASGPSAAWQTDAELVKLADFGLAKCVLGEEAPMTSVNAVVGTPVYMSPEQCRAEPLDGRSDVYSLGATYFALLTGRPPYVAEQPIQVMFAHCSAPVPDPRAFVPQVAPGCREIVERALAKEPADRFQSAGEMLAALLAIVEDARGERAEPAPPPLSSERAGAPTVATGPLVQTAATGLPRARPPRRGTLALLAGALAAVLLGLGLLAFAGATYFMPGKAAARRSGQESDSLLIQQGGIIPAGGQVQSLAFSHRAELLARGEIGAPSRVRVFDLRSESDLPRAFAGDGDDTYLRSVAFVPGREILAATIGSKVWLFEPRSGASWKILTLDHANASKLAISPAGDVLVVGEHGWGNAGSVVWRYELRESGGRLRAESPRGLTTHSDAIKALAISPDGGHVASVSKNSQLRLYSIAGGDFEMRNLPRHDPDPTDYSHAVAFSGDGKRLAAVADRRVIVWRLPELIEMRQFDVELHPTNIALAFSPDPRLLASGSTSGVKLWNIETGEQQGKAFSDHAGEAVVALVFVPASDMLITGGNDKRVSIRNWREAAMLPQP